MNTVCSISACGRPLVAHGLCGMHYARERRNGDPMIKLRARGVMDAEVFRRQPRPQLWPSAKKIARQLKLAVALVAADGEVVSIESLMRDTDSKSVTNLYNLVYTLRARLKDWNLELIVTERNKGYRAGNVEALKAFLTPYDMV